MAESLSGSDLDEVIKHPQILESSSSANRPDEASHDTKYPPFSLKDVQPLTKTKKPNKDKAPTTKRPNSHRTLDYRKGNSFVSF